MLRPIHIFLSDEAGAVSFDWVVLTAVLVATGLSVMGTIRDGIETASASTASVLQGHLVRTAFESDLCSGGITALQAREDRRRAAGGTDHISVRHWLAVQTGGLDDNSLILEYHKLAKNLPRGDGGWSRDRTIMTALECEMVLRGLD
ncbi:hypothetical protein JANAI62_13820 [Jannaschia pagri]|uniref:Uncharacterized protein n=1 Tax=Jannaschia pagri TaxID=2829797 RepID=A0ABQ4NK37_9RHOB|nr:MULTISPECIES: hypothetical protein [unclassified Jannaschia]GIT90928.1 hypothetical protein JANAI61_13860 [Jannaschia sp. AI_61]GIT94759.1 hypothetical protein JANAI62_13820 [Jannaschia sp. AI_62]